MFKHILINKVVALLGLMSVVLVAFTLLIFVRAARAADVPVLDFYFVAFAYKPEDLTLVDEFFMRESRHIRSMVGRNLHIRHIPEFSFKYDPSVEQGARIEQLLEEINKEHRDDQAE